MGLHSVHWGVQAEAGYFRRAERGIEARRSRTAVFHDGGQEERLDEASWSTLSRAWPIFCPIWCCRLSSLSHGGGT